MTTTAREMSHTHRTFVIERGATCSEALRGAADVLDAHDPDDSVFVASLTLSYDDSSDPLAPWQVVVTFCNTQSVRGQA